MNLLKKAILIVSLFCVAMPARAMDTWSTPDKFAVAFWMATIGLWLLVSGIDEEVLILRENYWIHAACYSDIEETKVLLAKEGYVKETDRSGFTPLHWAANINHVEKVKLLLAHRADVNATDKMQATPLFCAAARGHIETVRCILQNADFSPAKKSTDSASQARIKEALLVCMRNRLPRDVRNKIISYLPEDILNQTHCRLALTHGADLEKLVAEYPFEWFLSMYDAIMPGHKSEFKDAMVPAITEYRMGKVRELLADPKLLELDPATTDPVILAMLDVANIEQHRSAIEQNVRKAFTSRVVQKYPTLKPIDLDKSVKDVLYADVQNKIAHD